LFRFEQPFSPLRRDDAVNPVGRGGVLPLAKSTSLYLDCIRLVAALAVMLSHLSWHKVSGGFLWPLEPYGHAGVVVFFVLSGFVISYTAEIKEREIKQFILSRLARLYSVIIPALLLTFVLDSIGQHLGPSPYVPEEESMLLLKIAAALVFVSQTWQHSFTVGSNHAYWSMPYEFWYYVIFAALFYLRGWKRVIWAFAAMLIAGPDILLMFPIWLIGVAAYHLDKRIRFPRNLAIVLFVASFIVIAGGEYLADGRGLLTRNYSDNYPPGFSLFDYAIGAALAVNILAARLPLERFEGIIRTAAGYTFSIYLFHLPILFFCATILPTDLPVAVRGMVMLVITVISVVALGNVTEGRKGAVRRILVRGWDALARIKTGIKDVQEIANPVKNGHLRQ
jgi:peptidoglycan/LPS O-acetylase OafA/YrhL